MGWDEIGHKVEQEVRVTVAIIVGTVVALIAFLLKRHKWKR